ncbi:26489_t:CDS:2 [Gigaspora margarita]|uniref:26489_t:CDS:1 n=1 Tax=Gigaspora margarita TaxID=4874 RepID=A0ABM8W501_GIGMA|nr:26489_t:CDS:2 [Gigaspora margarita]
MQATNAINVIHSTQNLTKNVKINNDLKPHILIKESVSKQFQNRSVHDYDNLPNSVKTVLKYTEYPHNSFAESIIHTYNHHQHLHLSSDDIWLTIVQGQKEISIYAEIIEDIIILNVPEVNWPETLTQLLVCDFLTTTPNSLTASCIVLLDTAKAYFSYSCMMLGCGIPKVTLEGVMHILPSQNEISNGESIVSPVIGWPIVDDDSNDLK